MVARIGSSVFASSRLTAPEMIPVVERRGCAGSSPILEGDGVFASEDGGLDTQLIFEDEWAAFDGVPRLSEPSADSGTKFSLRNFAVDDLGFPCYKILEPEYQ